MTIRRFISIKNIEVKNANAASSYFTVGFPAITGILGAVHALERRLKLVSGLESLRLTGVIPACSDLSVKRFKPGFDYTLIQSRAPLSKSGGTLGIQEEAKCDLTLSILIEFEGVDPDFDEILMASVSKEFHRLKLASGDILAFDKIKCLTYDAESEDGLSSLKSALMPGNVLISRKDLVINEMTAGISALDAVLSFMHIYHKSIIDDSDNVVWEQKRKATGWIVPIAVGYQAITDETVARLQRDMTTPHVFAESVVTLGEFVMAYKLGTDPEYPVESAIWRYAPVLEKGLYLCETHSNIS